jgi:HrpA-like RNA helicase
MSATLNANLFADHFGRVLGGAAVPILLVSGRMFPVKEMHLEEALVRANVGRLPPPSRRPANLQQTRQSGADSEESPELSAKILSAAAGRCQP